MKETACLSINYQMASGYIRLGIVGGCMCRTDRRKRHRDLGCEISTIGEHRHEFILIKILFFFT